MNWFIKGFFLTVFFLSMSLVVLVKHFKVDLYKTLAERCSGQSSIEEMVLEKEVSLKNLCPIINSLVVQKIRLSVDNLAIEASVSARFSIHANYDWNSGIYHVYRAIITRRKVYPFNVDVPTAETVVGMAYSKFGDSSQNFLRAKYSHNFSYYPSAWSIYYVFRGSKKLFTVNIVYSFGMWRVEKVDIRTLK